MRAILTIAAAVSLTGCEFGDFGPSDRYQSDFHYTYEMRPAGRVDVESFNGGIDISGWDENKVEIMGAKYGSSEALRDSVKVEIHDTQAAVEIRAIRPSSMDTGRRMGNAGARFTLHVPRGALLDRIETSNGAVKVRDVAQAEHLKTSNGAISATNVGGDVDAHTSNGRIDVDTVRGAATLRTSNGHIAAEGVGGALEAETSNGGIEARLDKSPSTPTKLTTSNGSIELTLGSAPKAEIRATTRNNSITLHLPPDAGAHLVADTSNGKIESDFDIAGSADKRRRHMDGAIGAGGPAIELSTSNGSIHILKGAGD